MNSKRILECGERIFNMQRVFNVKVGISRKDDQLPKRFLEVPLKKGKCDGRVFENFNEWLSEYYNLRGWDDNGIPKGETLNRLKINH